MSNLLYKCLRKCHWLMVSTSATIRTIQVQFRNTRECIPQAGRQIMNLSAQQAVIAFYENLHWENEMKERKLGKERARGRFRKRKRERERGIGSIKKCWCKLFYQCHALVVFVHSKRIQHFVLHLPEMNCRWAFNVKRHIAQESIPTTEA